MASVVRKTVSAFVMASVGYVGMTVFDLGSSRADSIQAVRLSWARGQGADSCAAPATIETLVAERLSTHPFSDSASRSIEAIVEHTENGWIVRIRVRDGSHLVGTRELKSEAEDCESIQSAAVLAIALVIDPNAKLTVTAVTAVTEPEEPPPAPSSAPDVVPPSPPFPPPSATIPPPAPAPVVTPTPTFFPPPAPKPQEPAQGKATLSLGGAITGGLVPKASPGVQLAGSIPVDSSWSLTARSLLVAESRPEDDRFSFGLAALGLGTCYEHGESISVGVCASAWMGSTWAVVHTITPTHPGGRLYVAASMGPMLRAPLIGAMHVEVGADLFVSLIRRNFTVTGWESSPWRQPAVGGMAWAGLGLHFP